MTKYWIKLLALQLRFLLWWNTRKLIRHGYNGKMLDDSRYIKQQIKGLEEGTK